MRNKEKPETLLDANAARRRLLFYWTLLRFLPRRERALVVDTEQNLVQRLLAERGYDCVRLPSHSALERYGIWIEPWMGARDVPGLLPPTDVYPVVLGSRSGVWEYRPDIRPGLRQSPPTPTRLAMTTLGEVLHNLREVGFIHINDDFNLGHILKEGVEDLAEAEAVLTLVLPRRIDKSLKECLNALKEMGFRLFDNAFRPLDVEACTERECVAIPVSVAEPIRAKCRLAMLSGELDDIDEIGLEPTWAEERLTQRMGLPPRDVDQELLASAAGSSRILREGLSSRRMSFRLDSVPADNWYPMESDGSYRWRWSGPGAEARMLLPVPAAGSYVLTCRMMAEASSELSHKAQMFVDGRYFGDAGQRLAPGAIIEIGLRVSQVEWTGALEFLIAVPKTLRPGNEDLRLLGIALDSLSLQWQEID